MVVANDASFGSNFRDVCTTFVSVEYLKLKPVYLDVIRTGKCEVPDLGYFGGCRTKVESSERKCWSTK